MVPSTIEMSYSLGLIGGVWALLNFGIDVRGVGSISLGSTHRTHSSILAHLPSTARKLTYCLQKSHKIFN